ncbi:uncharacterized protein [Spinacia oleracea]|uniref:Uncharacterized protein isoform X2 n=1 Tax=Spinacia oleracea TaxID=3562 RepID=A0ABM3QVF2_SPIOL|nr:uncharacterized protein LOC110791668 isoform X2 [Spinacia oleracea]
MKGVALVVVVFILASALAEAGLPINKPKKVRCKNKYSPCYEKDLYCPASCPRTCSVNCNSCQAVCGLVPPFPPPPSKFQKPKTVEYCNKPGAVCQDPRFIGADGITFYFHGKKDQDFCLVTDSNLHINAHFIGKRDSNMGRDFTWVQSLGILFNNHTLYIGALNTTTWNDAMDRLSLSYDDQPINLLETEGASWKSTDSSVSVIITRSRSTNAVEVEVEGNFKIKAVVVPITEKDSLIHKYGISPKKDCFAHLDLSFKFNSLSDEVNGVLGQTYGRNYTSRVKMGVANPVLGGEKEFQSSSMFATDCAAARYNGNWNYGSYSYQRIKYADLNCASGTSGRGVVCKR